MRIGMSSFGRIFGPPSFSDSTPFAVKSLDPCTPSGAAEQVFQQYRGQVFCIALRLLANEIDAEDVTQEVFLQVVLNLNRFRGECALGTWLYRITCNTVLLLRRKRATSREVRLEPPLAQTASEEAALVASGAPEETALHRELQEMIWNAVGQLPPLYRKVYVLADMEGLSNLEISQRLGLNIAAVKSRLNRARIAMRRNLTCYVGEINS